VHGVKSCGEAPFAGSFDTYVVLRVGSLECRTQRACYDAGAAWAFGEAQVFELGQGAAPPLQGEGAGGGARLALEAEVMSTWLISDEVLGTASVDLAGLEPGFWRRRRRRLSGRQGGELELAVRLEPEGEATPSSAGTSSALRRADLEAVGPVRGRRNALVICGGPDPSEGQATSASAAPSGSSQPAAAAAPSSPSTVPERALARRTAVTGYPFRH